MLTLLKPEHNFYTRNQVKEKVAVLVMLTRLKTKIKNTTGVLIYSTPTLALLGSDALRSEKLSTSHCGSNFQGGVSVLPDKREN